MSSEVVQTVRRHYGAELAAKATPGLRKVLAASVRVQYDVDLGLPAASGLTERAGSPADRLAIQRSWTGFTPASTRERRLLIPAVAQLSSGEPIANRVVAGGTLAQQRGARRRRAARLAQHFEGAAVDLVAFVTSSAGGKTTRSALASWLARSVYATTTPSVLGEVASDRRVERFDLPAVCTFFAGGSGAALPAQQRFDRWHGNATGRGVRIAVIDGEIAPHPWLGTRVTRGGQYTREDWGRPQLHATMLAGLMAADGTSYVGAAPGGTLLNYKVLATNKPLSASEAAVVEALQRAVEDGADVVNCSFGIRRGSGDVQRLGTALTGAIDEGVAIVKAVGNDGPRARTVAPPADAPGLIVVGACDLAGTQVAPYSSRGPTKDGRDVPDVLAPGGLPAQPLTVMSVAAPNLLGQTGTSQATALVSGLVACILEEFPNDEPAALLSRVRSMATPLPSVPTAAQGAGAVLVGARVSPGR